MKQFRPCLMLLFASVAGAALGSGVPANAADLGTRPVYKAPPVIAPVPIFTWTGCYIGGHLGGGWGRKDVTDPDENFAPPGAMVQIDPSGFLEIGRAHV